MSDDNVLLTMPFTKDEFRVTMFSMHPDKCPGLDGYNLGFYQQFWNLCSDEIFQVPRILCMVRYKSISSFS